MSPMWFVPTIENRDMTSEYTAEEQESFRNDPRKLVQHANNLENQVNAMWGAGLYYRESEGQKDEREMLRARMEQFIQDKRLLDGEIIYSVPFSIKYYVFLTTDAGLTPNFAVGCRRITPGDAYMVAIQKPNVDIRFTPVARITEDGLVGGDGIERRVELCAPQASMPLTVHGSPW